MLDLFVQALPADCSIGDIDEDVIVRFKAVLDRLPRDRHRGPWKDMSLEEILRKRPKPGDPEDSLSDKGKDCYLEALSAFFNWCKRKRGIASNPVTGQKYCSKRK